LAGACLALTSTVALATPAAGPARPADKATEFQAVAATDDVVLIAESHFILSGPDGNPRSWFIQIPHARQGADKSDYVRLLYAFDCGKRLSAVQSLWAYDRDDKSLYSADLPLKWKAVPPQTVESAALDYACASPERRPQIGIRIAGASLKEIVDVVTAPDWKASTTR
jgi:hypothetical protein